MKDRTRVPFNFRLGAKRGYVSLALLESRRNEISGKEVPRRGTPWKGLVARTVLKADVIPKAQQGPPETRGASVIASGKPSFSKPNDGARDSRLIERGSGTTTRAGEGRRK
ncbi:hypothetical protein KM043_008358 [Ampulex compressa]|nr:hypothetical protein KM043_008358 [Ampulex compressa]